MSAEAVSLKEIAFGDLERELKVTRRVLEALPEEKFGWTPHEKSMTVARLASHVADLPDWIRLALAENQLDLATAPPPPDAAKSRQELLERFDRNAAALRAAGRDVVGGHCSGHRAFKRRPHHPRHWSANRPCPDSDAEAVSGCSNQAHRDHGG